MSTTDLQRAVDPTRQRILDAARRLTEQGSAPSISAVARAAGISRQGLYLHFPSRAALLSALVDNVDQVEDLVSEVDTVMRAPDGPAQTRAWAQMQARRNPRIALVARALAASRHDDAEAAEAWQDRTKTACARGEHGGPVARRRDASMPTGHRPRRPACCGSSCHSGSGTISSAMPASRRPRYVDIVTTAALAALASPLREPVQALGGSRRLDLRPGRGGSEAQPGEEEEKRRG